MTELEKILALIQKHIGSVKREGFIIKIKADYEKINTKTIPLLYHFLNKFEDMYFIILMGLPCCLMPDASDHILSEKQPRVDYLYDDTCRRCYLMRDCPGWPEIIRIERRDVLPCRDKPKEIVVEITQRCNLNCKVCLVENSEFADIDFPTVQRIIDECAALGIKAIRFTGGEPFFNREAKTMLNYAKKNNLYVLLNTNATVFNDSDLEFISERVDNVLISLQGYDEKTDRSLTNSEVDFNRKISNIARLKSKVPIVRAGTVISRTFLNNPERYSSILKKIKIDLWELYRPISKDLETNEEFMVSKEDLLKTMKFLYRLKQGGMKTKIANPVPFCISQEMSLSLATLLGALADDGHSRMVWDQRGYFKPSYFINENLGTCIKEAWDSNFLKKIRTLKYLPLRCKRCMYVTWCRCGSRKMAHLAHGNYFSPDPLYNPSLHS